MQPTRPAPVLEGGASCRPIRILSHPSHPPGVSMNVTFSLGPLVSLIAGILILVMPRLLNYIVALYLIIIGIIGIFGVGSSHF